MIYVECNADFALVESLGVSHRLIQHARSKGRVCKMVEKMGDAVGLIDEDPGAGAPKFLDKLIEDSDKHGVRVLRDGPRKRKVIVLSPRLEEWLLAAARRSEVNVNDFGFQPDCFHELAGEKPDKVRELVAELKKRGNESVCRLETQVGPLQ